MQAEVQAPSLRPVLFYEGEFANGTLRLWSGIGTKSWNGQSWIGAGNLLGISEISETAEVRAVAFTCSLSGNVGPLIAIALAEARVGKPGKVWLGTLDASGAVTADPYLAFEGRLDVPHIEDAGAGGCTISMRYESHLADLQRARERRWTHEDQQIDYPGDRGFEYVESLVDQVLVW
jgi:hypothetical protein